MQEVPEGFCCCCALGTSSSAQQVYLQPCLPTPALEVLLKVSLESQDLLQRGHLGCPQPFTVRAPQQQ